jgi:DNA-binding IclR family transcriptional regulator
MGAVKKVVHVTEEDLLAELRKALEKPPQGEGLTGPELSERLGCNMAAVHRFLRAFQRSGRLEVVTVHRRAIDDRRTTVRAYRLRAAPKVLKVKAK